MGGHDEGCVRKDEEQKYWRVGVTRIKVLIGEVELLVLLQILTRCTRALSDAAPSS